MSDTTIQRIKNKTENFTIMVNEVLKRNDLSLRAKGLYAYLMTLPDDWKILKSEVYTHFTDGKTSVDTAFKELESRGYILKSRVTDSNNRFTGWRFVILESLEPISAFPTIGKSENREARQSGNQQLLSTENITNDKKKQRTKKADFFLSFPEGISESYKTELVNFIEHRKELRKPMTQRALDIIVKELEPFTNEERTTAINNSIASGWAGVFPQKKKDKYGKEVPASRPSTILQFRPTHCDICGKELVDGRCICGRRIFLENGKYIFEDAFDRSDIHELR
jgi:hypothetical protein